MILDIYPPLREMLDATRIEVAEIKTILALLEKRIDVYEQLMQAVLREKEGKHDN